MTRRYKVSTGHVGTNQKPHHFEHGDVVFCIDAKNNFSSFEVVKFVFNAYTDSSKNKVSLLKADRTIIGPERVSTVFRTHEEACRAALILILKRKEPTIKINNEISLDVQYHHIEENHPELILKYLKYIKNM